MRFAVILLVLLCAACAVGSVVTQKQSYEWYASAYSERTAALLVALYLDDVFHSPWFLAITAFLCGNLLLCNLTRIRAIIRRTKAFEDRENTSTETATVQAEQVSDARAVFKKLHMPQPDGTEILFSCKNRLGFWGAWVCHLGILLLIVGFTLGQATQKEYSVYGVAGQTKPVGDTPYTLTIDAFRVDLRKDDTVSQYVADVTVQNTETAQSQQAEVSVNHPATLFGMKLYQNSTGWAADVAVLKNGEELQTEILCTGESLSVADKSELQIVFRAFYPDYVFKEGTGPATASGALQNPGYLYAVTYRTEVVGMNVLTGDETVKVDEYEFVFSNPRSYTLIQIKQDSYTTLALLGGVVTLLGLLSALYLQPKKLMAVQEADGWRVYGYCPKGGALFADAFRQAISKQEE